MTSTTLKNHNYIKPWTLFFKAFLVLSILAFSVQSYAQNTNQQTISAKDITKIVIDGNQIFNIDVKTVSSNHIQVHSLTDGEYQNDYKIFTELQEGQLLIKLHKMPLNIIPDDKRNAHKVVAATLKVLMPEGLDLIIRSDIGSVNAIGKYKDLSIQLFQGSATVSGSAERATINTFEGPIYVITSNATIEATSNHGIVSVPKGSFNTSHWILKSIDGDITVTKSK